MNSPTADDERLLRRAFSLARFARSRGDGPYGSICSRRGYVISEGENTQESASDPTCHAEMNLIRKLVKEFTPAQIEEFTLYASTEPCPMCAGAIVAAGIKRLIYGASAHRAAELTGSSLAMESRTIFDALGAPIEVLGPVLEEEALQVLR